MQSNRQFRLIMINNNERIIEEQNEDNFNEIMDFRNPNAKYPTMDGGYVLLEHVEFYKEIK